MLKTLRQPAQQPDQQPAKCSSVSLNSVMRHGGVTLQNIHWRALNERSVVPADCAVSERLIPDCTLPLTLDLLDSRSLNFGARKLIIEALPAHARPIVIYGAVPVLAPALAVETLNEIILTGNSVRIEPQLHKLRVKPLHQRAPGSVASASQNSFDTILFCSGVVIGDKPVIFGVAFSGEADRDESASVALRKIIRQVSQDQIALTDILVCCLALPDLARVLIDTGSGDVIWRNQSARHQWEQLASLIDHLANLRCASETVGPQFATPMKARRQFTLITFLRSNVQSVTGNQLSQSFKLSAEVHQRLNRVIEGTLAQGSEKAGRQTLAGKLVADKLVASSTSVSQVVRQESDEQMSSANLPMEFDNKSVANRVDSGQFEEARRALEIALRRLPKGGCLKLSPLNRRGQVRMESFDKEGVNTVDITLTDKTFPDSDNIL